jgi:hypothetical protein
MTRHRTITPLVGLLLALALCLVAPVAAQANPILSGYGGPGLGNQTILGSALLNGPAGGGGGPAGGGSAGSGSSVENGSATTPASVSSARGRSSGGSKRSRSHGGSGAPASSPQTIAQPRPDASSAYLAAERGHAVVQSGALGLDGQDLLYIILALGALTLAAVCTRRLTPDDRRRHAAVAKDMRRGDRVTG